MMTRPTRRLSAARLAFQLAILAPLASTVFSGCSSGVKTVTVSVDCPTGGTGALGAVKRSTLGAARAFQQAQSASRVKQGKAKPARTAGKTAVRL